MVQTRNEKAFLQMIAVSELGEALLRLSDDGYNVIVGSTPSRPLLFNSYLDHPRKRVSLVIKGRPIVSTAAGRYQVLARYFDAYRERLDLPDFGYESQDRIALQLIRECGALHDVNRGNFDLAVRRCSSRWASLPGAGYGQHENSMLALEDAFVAAGGLLA